MMAIARIFGITSMVIGTIVIFLTIVFTVKLIREIPDRKEKMHAIITLISTNIFIAVVFAIFWFLF